MTKIVCTNESCSSHKENEQRFSIELVVDENCELTEIPANIDDKYFTCCFCNEKTAMKFQKSGEQVND